MSTRPLLPGTWIASSDQGLQEIDPSRYEQLYAGSPFGIEGIPSPWAAAICFTRELARETASNDGVNSRSGTLWTLFWGLYLNVLELQRFPLKETHPFYQLLKAGYDYPGNNFNLWGVWFDTGDRKVIVGGTYPDCLLFPAASVKKEIFEEIDEEIQIGMSNLRSSGHLDEHRARLRSWVNTFAQAVPDDQARPWLKIIRGKTADWQPGNNPAVRTGMGMPVLKSTGDDIPQNDDFPFCETTEKWKMLTHGVACFTDGRRKVLPDIPVRPECLSHVDPVNSHYYSGRTPETGRWLVKFRDGPILPSVRRRIEVEGKGSIFVWPNFYEKSWRINYLAVYLETKIADLRVRGVSKEKDGHSSKVGESLTNQMGRVEGLEFVAVEGLIPALENEGPQALGIFKCHGPGRQTVKNYDAGHATLALDFGTTNTCLAFRNKVLPLKDKTVDILGFDLVGAGETGKPHDYWLPTSNIKNEEFKILPSEIVFRQPITEIRSQLLKLVPTKDFTIWRYGPSFSEDRIVGNFKWRLDPDTGLQGHERELVKKYLEFVMEMALAEMEVREVELKFTYPLAFNDDQVQNYYSDVESIATSLHSHTGIILRCGQQSGRHKSVSMIGESYAGLFATAHGTADGTYLTVDLGGGSTDIALIRIENAKQDIVFSDSIRYGGKDLIRQFLVSERVWYTAGWTPGDSDRETAREKGQDRWKGRIIEHAIRNSDGQFSEIRDRLGGDRSKLDNIQTGVEAFFKGLIEYLALILEAKVEDVKAGVKLVKLGQGWGLLGLAGRDEKYLENILLNEYGVTVEIVSPKVHPKEAVAIGASRQSDTPPRSCDIKTILGWDEEKKGLPWNVEIPCDTINNKNKGQLSFKAIPPTSAKMVSEYLKQQRYQASWALEKADVVASFRDSSITKDGILRGFFGHFLSEFHIKKLLEVLP